MAFRDAQRRLRQVADLNAATGQRGHSWALPGRPPHLVWNCRTRWTIEVGVAVHTQHGIETCRARGVRPRTVQAVARACATYADSRTGRGVTASNRTLARRASELTGRAKTWCHDVVTKARAVLAELGLAVELARGRYLTAAERLAAADHHGGEQSRAASTWALTSHQTYAGHSAVEKSSLPRRGSTPRNPPGRSGSPTRARTRATGPSGPSPRTRGLPAHRLAADLVRRAEILDTGHHLGSLVAVLDELVDCERWTGRDVLWLLDQDNRWRGLDAPTHITRPAAWLRARLSTLADQLAGPTPTEVSDIARQKQRAATEQLLRAPHEAPASAETRRHALEMVRVTLDARKAARHGSATRVATRERGGY